MNRFGKKLRALRKRHTMSIRELTRTLGYKSHSYISRIESGKKKPSIEFIIKVAGFFEVPVDQLIRDELEVE